MKRVLLIVLICITAVLAETRSIQPRIINGTVVDTAETRWKPIVSLKYNGGHYCGASLITSQWVLTAAHCWWSESSNAPYSISSGDTVGVDSYDNTAMTEYHLLEVHVHPDYNSSTMDNDIALLKLDGSASGVPTMRIIDTQTLANDDPSWVAGWGNTSTTGDVYPSDLMEVLAPIIDRTICNGISSYYNMITENMICAGYMEGGKDSCQGDSGGPLILEDSNGWYQIGIVSWGYNCAEANYPGVYTNLANFRSWVETYTGPLPTGNNAINPALLMYLLN